MPPRTAAMIEPTSASSACTHFFVTAPLKAPLHSWRRARYAVFTASSVRKASWMGASRYRQSTRPCLALGGGRVVTSSPENVTQEPSQRRASYPPEAPLTCIPPRLELRAYSRITSSSKATHSSPLVAPPDAFHAFTLRVAYPRVQGLPSRNRCNATFGYTSLHSRFTHFGSGRHTSPLP